MKRTAWALAVPTALFALSGCTLPGAASDPKNEPPSCGQCQSQVANLKAQVEEMPAVSKVGQFRYNSDTNAGGGPSLNIDLAVAGGDAEATADKVFEAAWKSRVTPLETVVVNTGGPGSVETSDARFYGKFLDEYETRWGPRPVK
ncbi:hypothetical protein [Nocardioides aurantiacus]|uniref:Lipoprotein n=1 Tax=Nocardioides aurantiacus TaxID=86796 RepID=A0A3N2CTV0_9ACTN|nr:hypothetical protein [Nocardioides aurantiacus]ROR90973.1 hypothetical protein EDD33_1830 [Nocardioides aurantiacus]